MKVAAAAMGSAAVAPQGQAAPDQNHARKPNFVLVFLDDLGYGDLGCYGAEKIRTPNIDRMAAEGMKFTDFYAAAPVCTPSRAAIMTGCYPPRVGLGYPELVLSPLSVIGLNPKEVTVARLLKDAGYATACVGKWHLGHLSPFLPTNHGFDSYYGIPYSNDMAPGPLMRDEEIVELPVDQATLTERYTEEAVSFIRENRDKPFFLYLAHTFPHTPLFVSERFAGKSEGGLYGDVVECLDWSMGRILDTLAECGLDENTLVIFTSDNGPWLVKKDHGGSSGPLRSGKGTVYDGGMRVPCIARMPGTVPAGTVCREVTSTIDVLPTFAAMAGTQPPTDRIIDGKDIGPLLRGEPGAKSPHEAFFFYAMDSLQAVRSGPWKLVFERIRKQDFPFEPIENPEEVVPEALYNLEEDIAEQNNVIDRHPDIAERLRGYADAMREDIGDNPMHKALKPVVGKNRRPAGVFNEIMKNRSQPRTSVRG